MRGVATMQHSTVCEDESAIMLLISLRKLISPKRGVRSVVESRGLFLLQIKSPGLDTGRFGPSQQRGQGLPCVRVRLADGHHFLLDCPAYSHRCQQ